MEKNNAVVVTDIIKRYQSGEVTVEILKEVSLEAKKGDITMIVGPSGSGKTTLLSIIAGILRPDHGAIHIFGNPIHRMSKQKVSEYRKVNLGFVFQDSYLIETLTTLENVAIPLIINGMEYKSALSKAHEMLDFLEVHKAHEKKPENLSGGEKQRAAIARALIHHPKLIICDEPTSQLDMETGTKVLDLIHKVAKKPDTAVLMVTHDPRIFKYADKIYQLEDGIITN